MSKASEPEASGAVAVATADRPTSALPATTVYAAQKEHATIVCAQCGTTKAINVADFAALHKPLRVKCSCGYQFALTIEVRTFYRKSVRLVGEYIKGRAWERMRVEDISRGGLGFRTEHPHTLKVGERIVVRFRLDDPQRSEVRALVEIRRIEGLRVGAAWVDVGA